MGAALPYVLPLLCQLLGALATFALLLSSLALCLANVSASLIAACAWGHNRLWPVLFRATRWTTDRWAPVVMICLAPTALLLASGVVTEWAYSVTNQAR